MAITRLVIVVMRLNAVPLPKGTTTITFHVFDGIKTWVLLEIWLPSKPLGPHMINISLPASASVRE